MAITGGVRETAAGVPAGPGEALRHLGFVLRSALPGPGREAQLLVAIRERPTGAHFDPELVRYWRTGEDGRGHRAELTLRSRGPMVGAFSWGKVELVDRFGIENEFVSVGGTIRAERTPDGMFAVLASPAPILRMGGHSQAIDRVALELAAFFGRMMVPIDFQPGREQQISRANPLTLYAAFIGYEAERYRIHGILREEHQLQATIVRDEAVRLRRDEAAAWLAGQQLLECLAISG
jgi:hypothetical protein